MNRLWIAAMLLDLAHGMDRGKGSGIDRRLQLAPEMPKRTNVILMCVRYENRFDAIRTRFKPADVRQDQINARCRVHVRERHA